MDHRAPAYPRKVHEIVADQMRARVLSGELAPGDHLPPEDVLTAEFGIARNTLREALRVLESQGLVRVRRGRGGGPTVTHPDLAPIGAALATVLQLRGTTVADLDTARMMIELQIVGRLAERRDAADTAAITAAIDEADVAAEADDFESFAAAAARVHETIIERSGNTTVSVLATLLRAMVHGYYARHHVAQPAMRRAVRSYRRLVKLVADGLADEAVAHWEAQMRYTIARHDPDEPVTLHPSR